jgi:murein DD-endopeptidase MepM/ murein hydrolase activator NlpD
VTPRLVGALALVVATTGAVHAAPRAGSEPVDTASLEVVRAGAPLEGAMERTVRVSRDSSRQAFSEATGADRVVRSGRAKEENAEIAELAANAEKVAAKLLENAWQLPLSGYRLTATFGQCSGLWAHCHTGLDFAAPSGTPIKAIANGTITETDWAGAYGNRTVMTLEDGTEIWYCHQTSFAVKPGDAVVGGQTIGYVGSTGNSTGPHLHLEVRPGGGDAVDPQAAFSARGITP